MKRILNNFDVIGSSGTPATLTAAYSGNLNKFKIQGIELVNLQVQYTPKTGQTNRYAQILIELANSADSSIASATWMTYSGIVWGTTENDVFSSPFIVPGSKVSTGGTAVLSQLSIPDLAALWIRVSVLESGSANFGTIWINASYYEDI